MPASNLKGEAITRPKPVPQVQVQQLKPAGGLVSPATLKATSLSKLRSPVHSTSHFPPGSRPRSVFSGSRREASEPPAPKSVLHLQQDGLSVTSAGDEHEGLLVLQVPADNGSDYGRSKRSVLETLTDLAGRDLTRLE